MAGVVQADPPLVLGQQQQYAAVLGADQRPRRLGAGGYGAVWLFQDNHNNQQQVAIKRMQLTGLTQDRARELFRVLPRELGIHYRLNHPHIAHMRDVFLSDNHTYINIVLEYVNGGSVLKHVNGLFNAHHFVSEDDARWLFRQVVITLEYLHAQNPPVSHRDIKLENALAQNPPPGVAAPGPLVKVLDFGLSTTGHVAGTLGIGTWEYKAPELDGAAGGNAAANNNGYNAPSVDIWATGVMLYAVLNMQYPWTNPATRWQDMHARPLQYNRPHPAPLLSAACTDLLEAMLNPDPAQRITIQGITQHPWFLQGLDPALLQINGFAMQLPPPNALDPQQIGALVLQAWQVLWPQLAPNVQQQWLLQQQQQQVAPQQQVALQQPNAVAANMV